MAFFVPLRCHFVRNEKIQLLFDDSSDSPHFRFASLLASIKAQRKVLAFCAMEEIKSISLLFTSILIEIPRRTWTGEVFVNEVKLNHVQRCEKIIYKHCTICK